MSEKDLDTVLLYLGRAKSDLNAATDLSKSLLHDHNVEVAIRLLYRDLSNLISDLNVDYRATHFKTKRR